MSETVILDKDGKETGAAAERKKNPVKMYKVKWDEVSLEGMKKILSVIMPQVNFNFQQPGVEEKFKAIEKYLEEVKL